MKTKIKMLLCMFVGMFGYCMLTFAQPSLEEQKVKIERWKREFKSLERQYAQNHVLHNGGGLVAKLSKKNHSRELARWRTLYEKTAADRKLAKAEWLRLKAIIVTTTDSVEKERLMSLEHDWLYVYQTFNGNCRTALTFMARLDTDRILAADEQTLRIAKRLKAQEKIFPKGQEKKMKAVQREIRDKYMKPLYQKMALVPNSVSERDVQIDSLHLIHRALIYYKKASLLDD